MRRSSSAQALRRLGSNHWLGHDLIAGYSSAPIVVRAINIMVEITGGDRIGVRSNSSKRHAERKKNGNSIRHVMVPA
jgi:hypothetical protein